MGTGQGMEKQGIEELSRGRSMGEVRLVLEKQKMRSRR